MEKTRNICEIWVLKEKAALLEWAERFKKLLADPDADEERKDCLRLAVVEIQRLLLQLG
jgi:hypothetical protein